MSNALQQFILTVIIFIGVCACTLLFITPYYFTSFIGPTAGITTALVIFFGARALIAIFTSTVMYSLFLYFWLDLAVAPSMVIITLLAFMLQGLWAKQLTYGEVNRQKWLKSRFALLMFLFKVGPLSSFVAAFLVVVLSMLENKEVSDSLVFSFASSWSSSMLFAIFFTPILLLFQSRHLLNSAKQLFTLLATLLAVVSLVFLFDISQESEQNQRKELFSKVKFELLNEVLQEIDNTFEKLNSLSAFLKVTPDVARDGFNFYTQEILNSESSITALEWAPLISHAEREVFEEKISVINEESLKGILQLAKKRETYAPIKYVYPHFSNHQVIGLDILASHNKAFDMNKVISNEKVEVSAPVYLLEDEYVNPNVLFIVPVLSNPQLAQNSIRVDKERRNNLLGFVVAVVQFEGALQKTSLLESGNYNLFIEDITDDTAQRLFGQRLKEKFRYVDSSYLDVGSRKWRISLGENQPWQLQEKNWHVWEVLFGTTLGGILFQVLILMMVVYSNELSAQVDKKTRELVAAKEQSENENTAKTNFLNTLTRELQASLKQIISYSKPLNTLGFTNQKSIIHKVELAQENMSHLLIMASELPKIELKELILKNEPIDFYGFINRVDSSLNVGLSNQEKTLTFLIAPNVPHFINSDEQRVEQLVVSFSNSVHNLFNATSMRITIKIQTHSSENATLIFVFTSHGAQSRGNNIPLDEYIEKDIALYSTEMTIAKELCQLMNGNIEITTSGSGELILTVSVRVNITSNEQQQKYQAKAFDTEPNKY